MALHEEGVENDANYHEVRAIGRRLFIAGVVRFTVDEDSLVSNLYGGWSENTLVAFTLMCVVAQPLDSKLVGGHSLVLHYRRQPLQECCAIVRRIWSQPSWHLCPPLPICQTCSADIDIHLFGAVATDGVFEGKIARWISWQ